MLEGRGCYLLRHQRNVGYTKVSATAFSAKAVKNGELRVLWMMADKGLFVQCAGPNVA